jgi:MFS family permease
MLTLVPNGPYRKMSDRPNIQVLYKIFGNKKFRSASFGYFGHMWELYTFWAFVPVIISTYKNNNENADLNISLLSFIIIAVGGLACIISGYLSQKYGAKKIAAIALFLSGLCCIVSPAAFLISSKTIMILFLIIWGMAVVADSPMFSTLVAQNAAAESKGTALTIVTCIGFSITIVSIQLLTWLIKLMDPKFIYIVLAIGPVFGLVALLMPKTELNNNIASQKLD